MKNKTFLFLLLILSVVTFSATLPAQPATSQGEKLERKIWTDIESKNWSAVESAIASDFQSIHPDGARSREEEITLIKNLNLKGKTELSGFKVTEHANTIVVTYMISVHEMIEGKELPSKPAPRMSVWEKTKSGWQWICHANLNPM